MMTPNATSVLKTPRDLKNLKVGEGGWATLPMRVVYTGKNPLPHGCGCGATFATRRRLEGHRKRCAG